MAVDAATFIASWFTPSSLFIIVNLVIGTIAITSRLTSSSSAPPKKQINHEPPQLARSPSLLNRLSSFNLSFYQHHPIPAETHYAPPDSTLNVPKPSLLERVRSFTRSETHEYAQPEPEPEPENMSTDPKVPQLVRTPSLLERVRSMNFSRLYRSDSLHRDEEEKEEDPNPTGFNVSGKVEMKKSASERGMMCESSSSEEEDEETVERRRPATVSASTYREEDEEVDTKADDFINRFKKQLRLQRLDSLLRYRDNNAIRGN